MGAARIINVTPLPLFIAGEQQVFLEPLKAIDIACSKQLTLIVSIVGPLPGITPFPISVGPDSIYTVDLDSFKGRYVFLGNPALLFAVRNDTNFAVDTYDLGTGSWRNRILPKSTVQLYSANFLFRYAFAGDVVGIALSGLPQQNVVLTDEFPKAWREYERNAASRSPERLLVGAVRTSPEPESSDYIRISERARRERSEPFNNLKNRPTRSVTISGATLKWKADNKTLWPYQGAFVADLAEIEMVADRVVVSSPLRFPRTRVIIRARELVFEGDGSIDTTPMPHPKDACLEKDAKGRPKFEKDAAGNEILRGASGAPGEPAGDIDLWVSAVRVDQNNPGINRFICRGSKGQQSEPGGLKKYACKDDTHVPAADPSDWDSVGNATAVKIKDLTDWVQDHFIEKRVNYWRWPKYKLNKTPGGVSIETGETYHPEEDMDSQDFAEGNVVSVRLRACDDDVFAKNQSEVLFPSPALYKSGVAQSTTRYLGGPQAVPVPEYAALDLNKSGRFRSGDGRDAYPSGTPGKGGAGGKVTSRIAGVQIDKSICDVRGGEGGTSPAVKGGPGCSPRTAKWLDITIVKYSTVNSSRRPEINISNMFSKDGSSVSGEQSPAGGAGDVSSSNEPAWAWLQPASVEAVLNCARDAFRAGRRQEAHDVLEPCWRDLDALSKQSALEPGLQRALLEMEAMRDTMKNNVDYYGNPPGWVPRLGVASNFGIWAAHRQTAVQILYYAGQMEKMGRQSLNQQMLIDESSNLLDKELNDAQKLLPTAGEQFKKAKESLDAIRTKVEAVEKEVESLRLKATAIAKDRIREQQIFSGACKLVGGLLQVIPVAQPFLGGGGKALSLIGDFDWNKPNPLADNAGLLTKLSEATGTFLDKHSELIQGRAGAGLTKALEGAKSAIKAQDETMAQITKGRDALIKDMDDELKSNLAAIVKPENSAKVEQLNKTINQLKERRAIAERGLIVRDAQDGKTTPDEARMKLLDWDVAHYTAAKDDAIATIQKKIDQDTDAMKAASAQGQSELAKNIGEQIAQKQALKEALKDETTDLEKQMANRKTQTTEVINQVKQTTEGLATIGAAVVAMSAPVSDADPTVARLRDEMLKSQFKDDYKKLLDNLESVNREKSLAVASVIEGQQLVAALNMQISRNVTELCTLSDQRRNFGAIDSEMMQYLAAMQQRARDRLLCSQYHFIKAYQYQYLEDPKDSFYNLERWATKLRALAGGVGPDGKIKQPTLDEFTEADKLCLKAELDDLFVPVLNKRQHFQSPKVTPNKQLNLKQEQLEELQRNGYVHFNLVNDMDVYSMKAVGARIVDMKLNVLKLKTKEKDLRIEVEICHSGQSVLRNNSGNYYFFQKASSDDPISWSFVCTMPDQAAAPTPAAPAPAVPTPAAPPPANAGAASVSVDMACEPAEAAPAKTDPLAPQDVSFVEYQPALFSQLTLWLHRGKYENVRNSIEKIEAISFTARISQGI
jgi:hypothetical protein